MPMSDSSRHVYRSWKLASVALTESHSECTTNANAKLERGEAEAYDASASAVKKTAEYVDIVNIVFVSSD